MFPIEFYIDMRSPVPDTYPVSPEYPVLQRPWGGEHNTRLMIELCPEAFEGRQVVAAIECGYVSTDSYDTPEEWVKDCCSGLTYDHHVDSDGYRFYHMHIDPTVIKEDSPYPYLISGHGGGEYCVCIMSVQGSEVQNLFERSFCCK